MTEAHKTDVVHFAPSEKALRQQNPMCGYVGTGEQISTDASKCTCTECKDWIRPPSDDPSPWCSAGHMSEASCTCGEIDSHD